MKLIASLLFITNTLLAQPPSEDHKVQEVVVRFFEGLTERNLEKMQECTTPDFTILEHGVIWNIDTLVALASRPVPADFKRFNTFDFFQTEISKDMAFVSYRNKAAISKSGEQRTVQWLESAVFVKEGKSWKMKMLHSTRLPKKGDE